MRRWSGPASALAASLVLFACLSTEPVPAPAAPDLGGQWNFRVNVLAGPEDQCVLAGTIDFTQSTPTLITGSAQTYSGSCLTLSGTLGSVTLADSGLTVHAGQCTLTAIYQPLTPDTLSGPASCVNTFGTWTGRWDAARTGAVASVKITPAFKGIVVGGSYGLSATVKDAAGRTLYGRTVTWSSSNTAAATVTVPAGTSGFATIQGVGTGTTILTAATPAPEIQILAQETLAVASPTFTSIDAGNYATCGLTAAGATWCWGMIDFATGAGSGATVTSPVLLAAPAFTRVSVGGSHMCGVTAAHEAWCMGQNFYGQLGTGDSTAGNTFRLVLGSLNFGIVVAGYVNTCGITTGGALLCWGANSSGLLGIGTTSPVRIPTAVQWNQLAADVDTWSDHTCAVTPAGAAYCWGSNTYGELGNGTATAGPTTTPQIVGGGLTFYSVTAGGIHTCGTTTVQTAWCWGNGVSGELGNGANTVTNSAPVAVSGGLTFQSVRSSFDFSCGRTVAGAAYCWGGNSLGQLGNGTSGGTSNVPVAVQGGLTFSQITVGGSYACGLSGGSTWCWGYNIFGQLGDGSTTTRTAPVKVVGQP